MSRIALLGLIPALLKRPARYIVDGASMAPALQPGDALLIDVHAYRDEYPRPGDMVVVKHPVDDDFPRLKRVIAGPGERVQFERGQLLVNGRSLIEPAEHPAIEGELDIYLGGDEYFVLGDNRGASTDSRSFGPVGLERFVGKVMYRYLPGDRRGPVRHHDRHLAAASPSRLPQRSIYQRQQRIGAALVVWGAGSVVAGLLLQRPRERPFFRGLGQQFLAWGAVDAAIGVAAIANGRRSDEQWQSGQLRPHKPARDADNLERLLWLNFGLDVIYIWFGGRQIARSHGKAGTIGSGLGVVIQGGFLLIFDAVNAVLLRRSR